MRSKLLIGTSGWHYDWWWGRFYPNDLAKPKWLEFYARHFPTVELNNSFYRLPSENAFANWRDSSPEDFAFAVKVSRFITHIKRLRNAEEPLDTFLSLLPKELEHVIEFRNESWLDEQVFEILTEHNVGFCVFDMPELTTPLVATADFAYIRFHGSAGLYSSCYSDEELKDWADKISTLSQGLKAVYIYFNNDAEGFAVRNAMTLTSYLG